MSILIVDDCPINIELLESFLEVDGFQSTFAMNGKDAIAKAQNTLPDLILLDVMMPGMDGFQVCQILKSSPQTRDIPVIFMTALTETQNKVKGLNIGAVDYITKPFQWEEVSARIQLHLKLRKLSKQLAEQSLLLEQRVADRTSALKAALEELQEAQSQLLIREERLRHDAFHDALTGLPNRTWLMECLTAAILKSQQKSDYSYAVLFLDLDRFKVVNDSFGHLVGDELLRKIALKLRSLITAPHTVARFGGDEFIILLERVSQRGQVEAIAQELIDNFKTPIRLKNKAEVFTGVSIGITASDRQYQDPESVLRDADIALYQAKQAGKQCYIKFDPTLQANLLSRLELENDLRKALELNQFRLVYQPIVCLAMGKVTGFEALLRWQHTQQGLVSPALFIPLAEEIGLINDLGWWALQEACQQLKKWQLEFPCNPPLTMNVNLSPQQLKQMDLVERLQKILAQNQLPKNSLKLEITESSILETNGEISKILQQLKDLGIQLCIDDFGTGYSSLSRLHELPIDIVKIDRSFIDSINCDVRRAKIIQTIIVLSQSLAMEVVAEGIETREQLDKLTELGCKLGQGYFFSRPINAAIATGFLQSWMLPMAVNAS